MTNRHVQLKKFYRIVYGDEVVTPGRLRDGQQIRVTDFNETLYFNDIDDLVIKSLKRFRGGSAYFQLATTNGLDGTKENQIKRSVLAFDFDKKTEGADFDHKEIIRRFKRIGLSYHAIVSSGNGFHVYMAIESTNNHELTNQVTKAIASQLGADMAATKSTQVLRIPYTLNDKEPTNKKPVNIVHMYELHTIRRYNIERLAKRFITAKAEKMGDLSTFNLIENTNIPLCVERIIKDGSLQGARNEDLQKIVVTLRQRNKVLSEILRVAEEWAQKCKPVFEDRLEYQVNQIYDSLKYVKMTCESCSLKVECKSKIDSNFSLEGNLISIAESQARHLKHSNRANAKLMNGNELMILGILKNHSDGLTRAQIITELTYTDSKTNITTIALCEKTLKSILKSLEENKFINATEGKTPVYTPHEPRTQIELKYNISYAATYEAIKGRISTEELRLYNYMRYIHHVEQRENSKALKGNLLQVTQKQLAKDLGITQGRASQMLKKLLSEKIISIWHKQKSKNNGFDFNVYRLNY
jgi:CTP-dependent riboflavin kinase